MNLQECLQILDIEDYAERIFHSNSHGELFHLYDYYELATHFGKNDWFRDWFVKTVEQADKTWERPASVFQHIPKLLSMSIRQY